MGHARSRRGRVDTLISYKPLPFPTDGFRVTTLHEEPRVLVTSVSHPLANEEAVSLRALSDEELVACVSTPVVRSTPKPVGATSARDRRELRGQAGGRRHRPLCRDLPSQ
ncbi:LysR family transcriptional regulator substrate-binding protein [Streptomyces pinistramenti]|uniref:LysR family transcriptional regulator substrate-binding protein n=1 Tax=Streptomyces pinistramenti TaxID=2884812 RepID=UPI001D07E244|nr:LysR family transcriptional regulator substrate-binding protein [Streptomyces pinistramenti]MCB5911498.1 LysR family transcriptional regulator substrate-binding protein [Streptomyces pinistramenti]